MMPTLKRQSMVTAGKLMVAILFTSILSYGVVRASTDDAVDAAQAQAIVTTSPIFAEAAKELTQQGFSFDLNQSSFHRHALQLHMVSLTLSPLGSNDRGDTAELTMTVNLDSATLNIAQYRIYPAFYPEQDTAAVIHTVTLLSNGQRQDSSQLISREVFSTK